MPRTLVLAFACIAVFFLPAVTISFLLPALSPFVGVGGSVAARSAVGLVSLPMLILVLWRRRFFCRYCCPVGLGVEVCSKARRAKRRDYRRFPTLGQWAALLTLGGALIGYPLFLFLDPVAMLAGALSLSVYAIGLALVLLSALLFPHLWCEKLCPLGGLQVLLADAKERLLSLRKMKERPASTNPKLTRRGLIGLGAGAAIPALGLALPGSKKPPLRPPGAMDEGEMNSLCIRCGNCVRSCPSHIIQPSLGAAGVAGFLTPQIIFNGDYCRADCNRCGRNCPTGAIVSLPLEAKNRRKIGIAKIDTFSCLLAVETECSACTITCRYGAIIEEFSEETYSVMVRVDAKKCNGCGECIAVCPVKVIDVQ